MAMKLDDAVPWGRTLDEYRRMFDLGSDLLSGRILGCGDGPASFNTEMAEMGNRAVSCDPVYQFSADSIWERITATCEPILSQIRQSMQDYVWEIIRSPDELGRMRLAAMERFLRDYASGKTDGRYVAAELPELPFSDNVFDLALCSHFLFLYSEQLNLDFHVAAIRELLRVSREVRIFPLLDLDCNVSIHVKPLSDALIGQGYDVSVATVPYEFQRGGNQMMRIVGESRRGSATQL
jgi:hypothetical protein